MGRGKNGVSRLSGPLEGSLCPPLFRKPSQKSRQSPLMCPRYPSDPRFHPVCIQAICPLSSTVLLFYLRRTSWVSKLKFRTWHTRSDPLGEGLAILWLVPVCLSKAVAGMHRDLVFTVKHSKKQVSRFTALSRCLYSYANEWGSSVAPATSFVSRTSITSPRSTRGRTTGLSKNDPGDPQTTLSAPGPLPSFSTGAALCPPGSTPATVQPLSSAACKNLR